MAEEFFGTSYVARALQVCEATVRLMFQRGELNGVRGPNGTRLFTREQIEAAKARRDAIADARTT